MAELIKKQRVDDLAMREGQEIEASETIEFSLDGASYRIDLGVANVKRLREMFQEFIDAAVFVPPKGRSSRARDRQAKIQREWAEEQGYEIKDRGRIPQAIQKAWREATGQA